jgi:hypothetical protein
MYLIVAKRGVGRSSVAYFAFFSQSSKKALVVATPALSFLAKLDHRNSIISVYNFVAIAGLTGNDGHAAAYDIICRTCLGFARVFSVYIPITTYKYRRLSLPSHA